MFAEKLDRISWKDPVEVGQTGFSRRVSRLTTGCDEVLCEQNMPTL